MPVLIPLFLFKADLRHMLFETTRMTMAFLIAGLGTVIGVVIAVSLLDLGALAPAAELDPALREAGIAGLFTSTYIGGSVNYAALGEITGLSKDASFFSAAFLIASFFSFSRFSSALSAVASFVAASALARSVLTLSPRSPCFSSSCLDNCLDLVLDSISRTFLRSSAARAFSSATR